MSMHKLTTVLYHDPCWGLAVLRGIRSHSTVETTKPASVRMGSASIEHVCTCKNASDHNHLIMRIPHNEQLGHT